MIHKKTNLRKKIWSLALCLCMIVSCLPVSAFAEADSGLCEHHHEHTAECGYVAAVEGQPCTHVHTDDCYSIAQCAHEHNESCGYSEGTPASECTHECGEKCAEGCIHEHDDTCGYAEATEATSCNHACSVEDGCYALTCSHAVEGQHDDTCGYVAAVEGSPCKYECNEDHGEEETTESTETSSPAYTAEEVKAMIDALPTVSEMEGMSKDELSEVHNKAQEAYDAFEALTDEEQIELTNDLVKLRAVLDYVTEQTMPLAADTSAYAPTRKENYRLAGNCIFANGTAITIEAAPNGTRVWYMDGSTKKYVTNNGENGEHLSDWNIFVGSANDDGMRGVNGSVTMTGGTVKCIYAGQYYGGFRGTSNITVIGGTVTTDIYCNSYLSQNSDKVGTVTIFDAVGTTINTNDGGKADNVVQKKDGVWSVTGNGVIPSGVTLVVNAGETLTVPKDATLTNNGSLVNNGTMNLYGPVYGNAFTGSGTVNCYAAYIEGISSVGNISASMNGNTYSLQSGDYYLQNGRLYIWLPSGNAKVTLNGTDYYGVTEAGKQTELTSTYVGMSNVSISEMPTEIGANVNVTLAAKLTGNTTLTPTISYELASSTAQDATVNGSTLYAAGAGKVTVKVKVSDGYTTKTENFEITVKHTPVTELSADVPASMIVNAKINLPKALPSDASYQTITWSIISGQSDTGATVNNGVLTATKKGTFTIRATVENGIAYGKSYTKDFTVKVVALDKESSLDIGAGSITISQNSDGTLKVEYSGYDGEGYRNFAASDLIVITGETETNRVIVKSGSPNMVLNDCKISGSASPFEIQSGATVNLTLNGTNTFQCWGENPGMNVPSGATVVIGGTGILNVSCSNNYNGGAGIGGKPYQSAGTVIINSGTIIAQGGYGAAGIGGGNGTSSKNGNGGSVTITGGTVTAIGGSAGGSGIGGGFGGSGGTVTITGGNVKAQKGISSSTANEIGSGGYGSGGTLTDANENSVSKVTFTLDGMTEAARVTAIEIEGCTYGVNGVSTLDTNKLYFYLPSGANVTSITTESGIYNCKVGNTFYKGHEYSTDCDTTCDRCGDKRDTSSAIHDYDENGICRKTTDEVHFKPAEYDETADAYKIENLGNLLWFRDQVNGGNTKINAILTGNINAKDDVAKIIGIGTNDNPFEGVFDGNNKTLDIQIISTERYAAPFAYVNGATIKNLTVTGSITSSQKFAASIIGLSKGTVILEKCISKVTITSTVSDDGTNDGTNGGLVANVGGGELKINNCAFVGAYATSTATNSGGFVGWTNQAARTYITNSFLAADFSGAKADGCNTFSRNPGYVTVNNCYYLTALGDVPNGATQKSSAAFEIGEVTWLLNRASSDGVWKQTINTDALPSFTGGTVYKVQTSCDPTTATGYSNEKHTVPTHTFDSDGFCEKCESYEPAKWNSEACVYEIGNAGQLYWFAALTNGELKDGTPQNPAANAVLKNDITVNKNVVANGALASDTSGFRAWTPIGDYSNNGKKDYAGTFDGNGHTVSGLYAVSTVGCWGFIGGLTGGTVKNITVADSYIESSSEFVGGIVGYLTGTVQNCDTINCIIKANSAIGGIAGWLEGTAEKCATIHCLVKGGDYVGGISGTCNNGTIINCYSTSILSGSKYVGGISGNAQYVCTIKNCYFAGTNNNNNYKSGITTAWVSNKTCKITVRLKRTSVRSPLR